MRPRACIRTAILLLTTGVPLAAQQVPSDQWHLNGTLGMSLNRTTQTTLLPSAATNQSSAYDTASGDLGLALNGFWKDPELLPFALYFQGERGSNSVGASGYRDLLVNWGVNTTFLPNRPYPFRLFYNKTQMDASGGTFGQTADTSSLGLDWSIKANRIPQINVGFTRFRNDIRIPTSLVDNNYRQGHAFAGANDTWKGWEWAAGFDRYTSTSNFFSGLALATDFQEDLRVAGARVHRTFWDSKAEFRVDNRDQWRRDILPGRGISQSTDSYTAASLRFQHTPKLSSNYFYNYVHVDFSGAARNGLVPGVPGNVILLTRPTFDSHFAGGRLDYRLAGPIRVFQAVRYQRVTPITDHFEFRESLSESLTGMMYQKTWRGFDLNGTYTGHLQFMGTNFGNYTHTFSNDVQGQVGWGNTKRVRLTGSASYSKLNLVDQLNGFSQDRRFRFAAETRAVPRFNFRFSADVNRIELLNQTGDIVQRNFNLAVQADHSRFSVSYVRVFGDGEGALFPQLVRSTFVISVPLPLDQLFRSPLLDRTTQSNALTGVLRLDRNLEVSGSWRTERNLLAASSIRFRIIEVRVRYRIGKITLDAGYGRYLNENTMGVNPSGLRTNRYLLRVTRDFRLF